MLPILYVVTYTHMLHRSDSINKYILKIQLPAFMLERY